MVNNQNNKKIAINTIVLYIKLAISIIIGLYTSRIILLSLGASDYGLYSVVGGIVSLLNILGITMMSATYRYISVEIGKGDKGNPRKVFNTIKIIHIGLSILLLLAGGIVGTYYVLNYLNIEDFRRPDALFVLYASLLTTAFTVYSLPYNGLINTREKFIFTSFIEVLQLVLKLLLIFLVLNPYGGNKLRLFAVLIAIIQFISPLSFQLYCRVYEKDVIKWKFNKNWADYKEILKFTFWLVLGAVCVIGNNQGSAIVMNLFYATTVNAAYGLAMQVQNYVMTFVKNISQAAVPQIMKSSGAGDSRRSLTLVYNISKYSFYFMLILGVPLFSTLDIILKTWLKEVPDFTSVFISFLLLNGLIWSITNGFDPEIQARGKIRFNQIGYSIINLLMLPMVYIAYSFGAPCYINVIIMVILTVFTAVFQVVAINRCSEFNLVDYLRKTVFPCFKVSLMIAPIFLLKFITINGFFVFFSILFVSFAWSIISIFIIGLSSSEKGLIFEAVKKIKNK